MESTSANWGRFSCWLTIHSMQAAVQRLTPGQVIHASCQLGVDLPRLSFGYSACGANWAMLWSVPLSVLVLGPLGRNSVARCQSLPVISPGLPVWSYKAIQFVTASARPGWSWEGPSCRAMPPATRINPMGQLSKIPKIHLHLPAFCWGKSLKELLLAWELLR